AAFAYERQGLARRYGEAHAVDRLDRGGDTAEETAPGDEMLDEASDFEERRAHVRCSARGARQHAAHCPDATSLKGGASLRHCATAKGQRGWKRQPLGIVWPCGTAPAIAVRRGAASSRRGM